ncbi:MULTISPECIES: hypothetical protein [unclassified Streptomyces]|uniref:hypothetical protein n=1 Tax=unclassified Streptomyces TaxID=2593676 RepID=UPI0036EB8714
MSRTQWCCLVAVLAVVLGLFCGSVTGVASDAAGRTAVGGVSGRTAAAADTARAVSGSSARAAVSDVPPGVPDSLGLVAAQGAPESLALVAASSADRHGIPGCGKSRKSEDGEPALPGRTRAACDQAPGPAEWGLPATGQGPADPAVRIEPRPAAVAPTPVELSVLRV